MVLKITVININLWKDEKLELKKQIKVFFIYFFWNHGAVIIITIIKIITAHSMLKKIGTTAENTMSFLLYREEWKSKICNCLVFLLFSLNVW